MAMQGRERLLIIVSLVLAALVVISNAAWYYSYTSLRSSYNELNAKLNNATRLVYTSLNLLNKTTELLKAYQGLANASSVALKAYKAEEAVTMINVSLELSKQALSSFETAVNLTIMANSTSDPVAKYNLAGAAAAAANYSLSSIDALYFIGNVLGANSTLKAYINSSEEAVQQLMAVDSSIRLGEGSVQEQQLLAIEKNYIGGVLNTENLIIALARNLSTS